MNPGAGCAGTGSVSCTCAIVTRTAGLMMSSTGLGYTPTPMISTTSGATASSSRGLRSFIPATCSRTGPPATRWYIHKM